MKRLLFCLVALVAVMAFVVPTHAAEFKFNGIMQNKYIASDNMNGNKNLDDNTHQIRQRTRMYFTSVASENLKMVYKNEIDFVWGLNQSNDPTDKGGDPNTKNKGGAIGGDGINVETKNAYLEFMVPNTPLKFTGGLQGVTLHRGWFISDDVAAARFDVNLDPFSVLAYYAVAVDDDRTASDDTINQIVISGAYKAENMDARLSLGYEKGQSEPTEPTVKDDDFYLLMGDFGMSFDMVSFFVIGGINFGKIKGAGAAEDVDYEGYMFEGQVDFALDIATLYVNFRYASGEKESDTDKADFRAMTGQTYSWAEIPSDGYFWEVNSSMAQIGGANHPSNMWAVAVGGDVKPTDTTSIGLDLYYIGMVEKRTIAGKKTDDVGFEIDLDVTQKVYDNLDAKIVGAVMFADDGYGDGSKDDGWVLGMGLNYKF